MTLLANAYKISRRIAVGDLGEVMLAAQHAAGGLEKLVVVKRLLPHVRADAQFVQIFLEAVQNAARLKHPGIAEIYEVVHDDSGHQWCMGYLPGEVNRQRPVNALDVTALIESISGAVTLAEYRTDINRSGVSNAQDVLRLIDLLNGAGEFDIWLGRSLPFCP